MNKLTYYQPAGKWTDALPLGNGRMGAMHFGGVEVDRFQLNEDTVWSGPRKQEPARDNRAALAKVRELIEQQKYEAAEEATKEMFGHYTEAYMPLGDVTVHYLHGSGAHNYVRELDISEALSTVTYAVGATTYNREAFISYPHQVFVQRVTSSKAEKLNMTISLSSLLKNQVTADETTIAVQGVCPERNVPSYYPGSAEPMIYGEIGETRAIHFEGRVGIVTDGDVNVAHGQIAINNATEAVMYLAAATSFNGFDQMPGRDLTVLTTQNEARLATAMALSYDELKASHVADYQALFNRVTFSLDGSKQGKDQAARATDQRIKARGAHDLEMIELLFQYGRYLMISGSRPGSQPMTLQGIWNGETRAPWSSNYTLNINTEMNYWPAELTNLSECHEPLLTAVKELQVTGEKMVSERYKMRGWTANHNTDVWRHADAVGENGHGDPIWAYWPMSGVWLSRHLFDHYDYTLDEAFLAEALDVMQGAAEFSLDWLVDAGDGTDLLTTSPSTSPEHTFTAANGQAGSVTKGSMMDLQMIWDLFTNCLKAADVLGVEADWLEEVKAAKARLYPLKIGSQGQLQEWAEDYRDGDTHHRHVSHLYALYPSNQITDGPLLDAARQTLNIRGDAGTGWSLGWKMNLWARLQDGERVNQLLHRLFNIVETNHMDSVSGGLYPNLLGAHPPFQIDGNFGYTAGVVEMIMQSHKGFIELLPALPSSWASGSLTGICARGGFTLDVAWDKMRLSTVSVTAKEPAEFILKTAHALVMQVTGKQDQTLQPEDGLLRIAMKPGHVYNLFYPQYV